MSTDFVTDTHGLIWYLEDSPLLGVQARAAFDACDRGECVIYIPSICLVEIIYLQEKGRIAPHLFEQLRSELASGSTGLAVVDLTLAITAAMTRVLRAEVPDMPDRIVAATALYMELPLISRDRLIQASSIRSVW